MVFYLEFIDRICYPQFEDIYCSIVLSNVVLKYYRYFVFYDSPKQLFRLHYWGIMDLLDLEWYTAILNKCKSLDINDFLHDVSPYMVT